jgi:hypothetical protein
VRGRELKLRLSEPVAEPSMVAARVRGRELKHGDQERPTPPYELQPACAGAN